MHAKVSHVQGVVPCPNNLLGDHRRERVIYEEPQAENEALNERDLPLPYCFCGVTKRLAHDEADAGQQAAHCSRITKRGLCVSLGGVCPDDALFAEHVSPPCDR